MKKLLKAGFFQKIFLPAMLAIILFVISSYVFIIPAFERNAIAQKKNMLLELTNTAWSILQKYQTIEASGLLTREEARDKAIDEIKSLRYGPDQKDYFWITDLTPIMVMHPYVQELNGKNLRNFSDPDGFKIFMEALSIVEKDGEGFMQYKWQFKDDPEHIDPKLSFVKKFSPWNWIIGTGLYLHDVQTEISKLTGKLVLILIGITVIITLIILFITFQSLDIENKRRIAEAQLHESKEKYKSLLESSTEGIILLLNNRISYTNAFIQNWLQYTAGELQQQPVETLFASDEIPEFEKIGKETRLEVHLLKRDKTPAEAVLTMLPVCFADKEGILLTFRDSSEYRNTRQELEDARNRLQMVSDHTGVGLIRFSLKGKNKVIDFNRNVATLLGYSHESELKEKRLDQVLGSKEEFKKIIRELNKKHSVNALNVNLRKKDNSLTEVVLHLNLTNYNDRDMICIGIIEPVQPLIAPEEFNSLSAAFSQIFARNLEPATDYSIPATFCHGNASILQAIEIMGESKSSALLILLEGKCIGIVTQKDIISRCLSKNLPVDLPVSNYMTSPLVLADQQITVEEAFALMEQKSISHLVLRNLSGEPVSVIKKGKLAGIYTNTPNEIANIVKNCRGIQELTRLRHHTAFLVKPLLNELGSVQTACKFIAEINEQISIRIIENSIREFGPPPVPWAFISLGSAGREELVFNSDQDNALIFEDHPEISRDIIQKYFLQLSSRICEQLDKTGLPYCTGGYMASNPRWCQPLPVWKEYFNEWIMEAEPENILNISVMFDFRFVYGERALFTDLEDHVFSVLSGRSAFYYFLAQSVARFKPPVNVFGNIITESSKHNTERIDIKNSLSSVIMFARIYALHHGIRQKNTLKRIHYLKALEVFNPVTGDELNFHFNFLLLLRMKEQIDQIMHQEAVGNSIALKKLNGTEQLLLKRVFSQMSSYDEKLSAEFMSAYKG